MDIQRLRNLTTSRLHTSMDHIYQDIEFFVGSRGIMTHQLPNAGDALLPWLKEQFQDPRLWDGQYDRSHVGDVPVRPMNEEEREGFWQRYKALPSPFARR
jgi:hypothetical protein